MESSTVTIRSLTFRRSVTICSMDRRKDEGEDEGEDERENKSVGQDEGENKSVGEDVDTGRRSINTMTAIIWLYFPNFN